MQTDKLERHISVFSEPHKRKNKKANFWIFDSPKNNNRISIEGDVAFMHLVLLEGEPSVERYELSAVPTAVINEDGKVKLTRGVTTVYFSGGREELWSFERASRRHKDDVQTCNEKKMINDGPSAGREIPHRILTELDLKHKEILFDNWLMLCGAITRARNCTSVTEVRVLHEILKDHSTISLNDLLRDPRIDPALMLALIAKCLQHGSITAELEKQIFGLDSLISRVGS